jgi:hypothetical protein
MTQIILQIRDNANFKILDSLVHKRVSHFDMELKHFSYKASKSTNSSNENNDLCARCLDPQSKHASDQLSASKHEISSEEDRSMSTSPSLTNNNQQPQQLKGREPRPKYCNCYTYRPYIQATDVSKQASKQASMPTPPKPPHLTNRGKSNTSCCTKLPHYLKLPSWKYPDKDAPVGWPPEDKTQSKYPKKPKQTGDPWRL